jgi:hypothetical protein
VLSITLVPVFQEVPFVHEVVLSADWSKRVFSQKQMKFILLPTIYVSFDLSLLISHEIRVVLLRDSRVIRIVIILDKIRVSA